jgi:glycosyltransferase involved in cell wall biosynthesis
VHLNSSKAGFLGAIAARLARIRHVVFTVHGWPFNEPVSYLSKFVRWSATLLTILLAHRTIAVSHFGTLLSPFGLKTKTIHNGIGPIEFLDRSAARKELCARAGISEKGFIFGTIAELHVNKGIDVLIEATYLVDDVQVIVIGEGEERAVLEELIRDLKLENRVHLIGFIDNASRYLKAFDTFVLPSRTEALGYVLLEAGLAEVPVIASAVGGIPEIVQDQISGDLFHAFNDLALAESMEEFKRSPNTIAHYAEALKAHVEHYFTVRIMIDKTLILYEH